MRKSSTMALLIAALFVPFGPANAAWWFLPWIIGGAKVIAVKTIVITKGSALLLAKQSTVVASTAKLSLISGKSVVVGGKVLSVGAIGTLLVDSGLTSSGSREIDHTVVKEIAVARANGLADYHTKVCKNSAGKHYPVPTDAVKCLDGKDPALLESSLKLSKLKVLADK